ncbi:hypothetical protein WYH_01470 [Croceibacterium atlanticum]|uniref:JAB1/MPN/MOV34 metalloenzyme domain-containing protein n=3 Tax=Croceibacterium atlanticum TaxID=1267766 RepID=A0A0F7KUP1_9SPHN|nr:hypothetical protein WYH_01470 [Croceibacterium atlanticum]
MWVMEIEVTSAVLKRLRSEAERAAPEECCGILLGGGNSIADALPAANVAQDPRRHFEVDPQTLVDAHRAARAGGPEVAGYYHSHPMGPAFPSATDRAMASGDGRIWAIIGKDDVTFWRDGEEGFLRLSCRLRER